MFAPPTPGLSGVVVRGIYWPTGIETVHAVTGTVPPIVIAVSLRIMSVPLVPQLPSITAVVSSLLYARNHVAVPTASPVPLVIALAVLVPPDDAPKAVALSGQWTSLTCVVTATSGVAG